MTDYSIREASELLHCSQDTIRRQIKSGRLQSRQDDRGRYRVILAEAATVQDARLAIELERLRTENGQLLETVARLSRTLDKLTDPSHG